MEVPLSDLDQMDAGYTVQILSIKKVTTPASRSTGAVDRFRVIISDGVHFAQAMLATQLNRLVLENHILRNTVVTIDKFTCNFVNEKRHVFFCPEYVFFPFT